MYNPKRLTSQLTTRDQGNRPRPTRINYTINDCNQTGLRFYLLLPTDGEPGNTQLVPLHFP